MSSRSEVVTVYPSPDLPDNQWVRGIGAAGRSMSRKEAQPLLDAGLVTEKRPYVVGDRGREIITPAKGGRVIAKPKETD